ncbi:MAG: trehalose-6-phosphate synthase [Gammaproteobacteria bacterium]|nr:trehalose-6-phosphate synthase [Gammaproteobacteria bacterium]
MDTHLSPSGRLVVVSNRLPVVLAKDVDGTWVTRTGSGGLVTALLPVLRHRGGIWIGWSGVNEVAGVDEALERATDDTGYTLKGVALNTEEVNKFYLGFSNEIIWPLFHDLQSLCNFDPAYWRTYCEVNRRYAKILADNSCKDDFIWVHDYHLMNVAAELRLTQSRAHIAFFLHIPFPPLDIFVKLPWRFNLLRALLEYDLIGFQTLRDQRNFEQCVRTLMDEVCVSGQGQVLSLRVGDRVLRMGSFPIGIDSNAFEKHAIDPEVGAMAELLNSQLSNRQLILGVDRLDYTKGLPLRLEALRNALQRYPELHQRITLIQVVIPSREDIPQYFDLKMRIERLVGEINGQFTRPGGWVPIHYVFRNLTRVELLAYYRAAHIALVTPLKDGMNLVAKEYCACSVEEDSVLILSEFAGAAAQLQNDALLVNPYDIEGVADAIYHAYNMDVTERYARMRRLRTTIREQDIFWWVDAYLRAAFATDLSAFPLPEDFVPHDDFAGIPY